MAQYPIPQFIEAEGKIISFLTFRQFFILVGGGAVCAISYYTLPFFYFLIITIFVGVVTAAVAFLKIDNESIVVVVINMIGYATKSKTYIWKKKEAKYPFKNNPAQELIKPEAKENRLHDVKAIIEYRKK